MSCGVSLLPVPERRFVEMSAIVVLPFSCLLHPYKKRKNAISIAIRHVLVLFMLTGCASKGAVMTPPDASPRDQPLRAQTEWRGRIPGLANGRRWSTLTPPPERQFRPLGIGFTSLSLLLCRSHNRDQTLSDQLSPFLYPLSDLFFYILCIRCLFLLTLILPNSDISLSQYALPRSTERYITDITLPPSPWIRSY